MKRLIFLCAIIPSLAGCLATTKIIEVPVPVRCEMPTISEPTLASPYADKNLSLLEKSKIVTSDLELMKAYSKELKAANLTCSKGVN